MVSIKAAVYDIFSVKLRKDATAPPAIVENPNFIRDRIREAIWKPMMNESWTKRFKKPFHPAWMDWCDPYHCNDYHKIVCGLNRKTVRFKWFQSGCHLILSNMCSTYRGSLKYDIVDNKYCSMYVMFLRLGCQSVCSNTLEPVCGVSLIDNHLVLFQNRCAFERRNCQGGIVEEYEEISLDICLNKIMSI
ncbi:uncharacterized protein LOC125061526 [Pieris napi]|uniref:uncharacterized protein LOC125061526 n=1 Tax=Pieris napi TaxID=78633 RepID=UPI001FB8CAB1|nr:uncharacterized protein LOC125061526 [Pieris napi]